MKHSTTLRDAQTGHAAWCALWLQLKPLLLTGKRLHVEVRTETRSIAENALLHAMLTHISRHQEWAGKKHSVDTWKRLLVAAWCRARGEAIELLPALDGHGVDIVFRRTSELTVSECAELIEFVYAWGVMNDVRFPSDPRQVDHTKQLPAPEKREALAC